MDIKVFVTPTCPHCPRAVTLAHRMAVESPNISATCVEASEFHDLSRQYRVTGVPKTVASGGAEILGALPEEEFVRGVFERPRTTVYCPNTAACLELLEAARPRLPLELVAGQDVGRRRRPSRRCRKTAPPSHSAFQTSRRPSRPAGRCGPPVAVVAGAANLGLERGAARQLTRDEVVGRARRNGWGGCVFGRSSAAARRRDEVPSPEHSAQSPISEHCSMTRRALIGQHRTPSWRARRLAEREGFEPPEPFRGQRFSRPPP